MNQLQRMQQAVHEAGIDAWLLYDFRGSNALAWNILDLPEDAHCTRRWMIVIPAHGPITKIVHRMERSPLAHVPATEVLYNTYQSWESAVRTAIGAYRTVAMEYSPGNALPVVSRVDAGTVEFIRSIGCDVVTSADLLQAHTAVIDDERLAGNAITAARLKESVMSGFTLVRERLLSGRTVTEFDVQQHIMHCFEERGLVTDHPPIVAIGPNAASPHYAPSFHDHATIEPGMVVLIDAWARSHAPASIYADITWVGFTGSEVPSDVAERFDVIVRGRDAAAALVNERFAAGVPIYGYEVDRACRDVIEAAGLGHLFIHRTGHSITHEVHGPGTNMDDFETHDTRRILPGTSFSIEPGVYEDGILGLRTEIDIVVDHDGTVLIPSAPVQQAILPLLHDDGFMPQ